VAVGLRATIRVSGGFDSLTPSGREVAPVARATPNCPMAHRVANNARVITEPQGATIAQEGTARSHQVFPSKDIPPGWSIAFHEPA